MYRFLVLLIMMALGAGCRNNNEHSFSDLLSKEPYTSITDSITRFPNNDQLYFNRGILLNSNNQLIPALADFEKAWSIKKEERYAFGIGNLLLDNRAADAELFLQKAIQDFPHSLLLRMVLARAYARQAKDDAALQLINEILQTDSAQINMLVMQADLFEKKGDTAAGIRALEKAFALAPQNETLTYRLAFDYAEARNHKVLALCDSLMANPAIEIKAVAYYCKGIYYSNTNETTKALAMFDATIEADYNYKNAYIEKGRILFDQKKYDEANKQFSLALSIAPDFADAYFWIAKCQEAAGNPAEAKLNYQRAYGLDKSFTQAKEAADLIKK